MSSVGRQDHPGIERRAHGLIDVLVIDVDDVSVTCRSLSAVASKWTGELTGLVRLALTPGDCIDTRLTVACAEIQAQRQNTDIRISFRQALPVRLSGLLVRSMDGHEGENSPLLS
jgi:hypothetical protein